LKVKRRGEENYMLDGLVDNPLTEDPNDFTLKVKAGNMVTTGDIAKVLQAEGCEFKGLM